MLRIPILVFFAILLMNATAAHAQMTSPEPAVIDKPASAPETAPREDPDVPAKYPGGFIALAAYLNTNVHYPFDALKRKIEGQVIVRFEVEADGSITNVKVVREIGGGCDEEAVRVVKNMPPWQPGTLRDKPVKTHYVLPVKFSLP
ncbi:MAG: energy transducer TonB [Sphingobacteriales bacterium]|nr:MAG: energy transducer TonB [Sphingobacteriales bacterium]